MIKSKMAHIIKSKMIHAGINRRFVRLCIARLKRSIGLQRSVRKNPMIALHTVFIARENILFLREWLEYYRLLGISEFYLYDNSLVQVSNPFNQKNPNIVPGKINKHNINYATLISISDDEIRHIMKEIQHEVPGVHYVPWSPLNDDGKVMHGQVEAANACQLRLSGHVDWVLVCDMDEFLVSPTSIPLLCTWLEEEEYDLALIGVIKMPSRWEFLDRNVLDIKPYIENRWNFWDGRKYLYRPDRVSDLSVHDAYKTETKCRLPEEKGFLLHYNTASNEDRIDDRSEGYLQQSVRDTVRANTGKYGSTEWRLSVMRCHDDQ